MVTVSAQIAAPSRTTPSSTLVTSMRADQTGMPSEGRQCVPTAVGDAAAGAIASHCASVAAISADGRIVAGPEQLLQGGCCGVHSWCTVSGLMVGVGDVALIRLRLALVSNSPPPGSRW